MAKLDQEHKVFIVTRLACYEEPIEVVAAVKEEFGLELTRQQVRFYDPTASAQAARELGDEWCDLFDSTRKAFKAETIDIAIAQRPYRLRALERLIRKAEQMRNYTLVAQLLEQAAKETGGVYTNARVLSGPGGGPIQTDDVSLSDDERAARVVALLERARTRRARSAPQSAPKRKRKPKRKTS